MGEKVVDNDVESEDLAKGRPQKTWSVVVEKDCQSRQLDRSKWRKISEIQNGLPFWCQLTQVVLEKDR